MQQSKRRRVLSHPRTGSALVVTVTLLAWALLLAAAVGGGDRWIDHDVASPIGAPAAPVFVGGWTLMVAAMMLPTTLWLVQVVDRVVGTRRDAGRLVGLLMAGYLIVWVAAGSIAYVADVTVHTVEDRTALLDGRPWLIPAAALLLAGAFQFSATKSRCLTRCRTPISFVASRWRGQHPAREAFRIGFDHGWFCLGCCWALMVVMMALGSATLALALLMGSIMATEKIASWGPGLVRPVGVACLAAGTVTAGASLT